MNRSFCQRCFDKQQRIDQLTEENTRLKQAGDFRSRLSGVELSGAPGEGRILWILDAFVPSAGQVQYGARAGKKKTGG